MTLADHLEALPRRLPPFPMGLLMVLLWLAIAMALVVFMGTAEITRRVGEAERTEQRTLEREQLAATRALVEEVQRLRQLLEDR
jgi:hypothetical protein